MRAKGGKRSKGAEKARANRPKEKQVQIFSGLKAKHEEYTKNTKDDQFISDKGGKLVL